MEVRNKMLEEIGSEQTEENQEDEEVLQKMREKKTSKIYPTSIMMNHRNENQKRAERNLSQKLHMFIERGDSSGRYTRYESPSTAGQQPSSTSTGKKNIHR